MITNPMENIVTVDIVRQALHGAAIVNYPELLDQEGGKVSPKLRASKQIVQDNYDEFRRLVWKRLENLPLIKKYFGGLIRARLRQKSGILASPIISVIFDDFQDLEKRLAGIQMVEGVYAFRNEYRGSGEKLTGDIADMKMRDMLSEILTLYFLTKRGFINIRKISRKDKAHTDIYAEKDGQNYAIEATRKQEITNWQIDHLTNLEDCMDDNNLAQIKNLIVAALNDKNEQFERAIIQGTVTTEIKVIALKTSDYGFSNCIEQAAKIAKDLINSQNKWDYVDCIWLIPNIDLNDSHWINKD